MAEFVMEIAGTAVRVEHRFAFTKEYCREYLSARIPEFSVSVSNEDLEAEQVRLAQEAVEQGLKTRNFGDPFLELGVVMVFMMGVHGGRLPSVYASLYNKIGKNKIENYFFWKKTSISCRVLSISSCNSRAETRNTPLRRELSCTKESEVATLTL